ncbi:site-specific integrase [Nitrospirillum pindoramense]|uniref:Site-specific recombinase XerD n=1 Tax=Nitrospirillum amazonense TaxID=28077 RepID=A0A560HGC5_9PROT|nr:site-specific integrase [Nitrospirillum amazonense]TWB45496.1 site-specific recombinase XerD [Nitrospirillum amazonense]
MAYSHVPHLVIRNTTFWFRMAVPKDIFRRTGFLEFKGSLRTRDPAVAKLLARRLSGDFEQLIARLRHMEELSHEKLQALVRGYFQGLIDKGKETIACMRDDAMADFEQETALTQRDLDALRKELTSRQFRQVIKGAAMDILAGAGVEPKAVSPSGFADLYEGVLRAEIESLRIQVARLEGRPWNTSPGDPLFQGLSVENYPPLPLLPGQEPPEAIPAPQGKTLSEVQREFVALKSKGEWEEDTRKDYERVLRWLLEVIGPDCPVDKVATSHVKEFRDMLLKIPANYSKMAHLKGMSLKELVALPPGEKTLSLKTVDKYFGMQRTFFHWCVAEDYLQKVPGEKLTLPAPPPASEARYPYSPEQLNKIFSSPVYTGSKSLGRRSTPGSLIVRDGRYWIPLVALFTGARLGEIVQLLVSDIKERDGCVFFDLNQYGGEKKNFKTESSKREVPIHPGLVDLGFMGYVGALRQKAPKGPLFPDINEGTGKDFSDAFSKWYGRYVREIDAWAEKTAFHSYRHNFKNALDKGGVQVSLSYALMGHADSSVHAAYGSKPSIKQLAEAMSMVKFEVDLSHLFSESHQSTTDT